MPRLGRVVTFLLLLVLFADRVNIIETRSISNTEIVGDNVVPTETFKETAQSDITTINVALFPYLPDSAGDGYQSLLQFIKTAYESTFPNFRVQLRQMNPSEDFYNLTLLTGWLTGTGKDRYDIVEIDTVLLGDLVNAGIISPHAVPPHISVDWHPAAIAATQINQEYYGIPHLLCAFFLFTRAYNAGNAKTIDELVSSLGDTPTIKNRLVGNLDSSWGLPALWIDSFRDTYPTSYGEALALHDYQGFPFESLRKLARLCDVYGKTNPCLDGTFRNSTRLTELFAKDQATAMFGYSERLFDIVKKGFWNDINNVKVTPLPLGNSRNEPVFFTDAFVFRRDMPNNVQFAAKAFAYFMTAANMQAAVVGSGDNPAHYKIPRYLLPISKAAYDQPLLAADHVYQKTFRHLTGVPYPNTGFYNTRKKLQSDILNFIK